MTYSTFKALLNTKFMLQATPERRAELVLIEAEKSQRPAAENAAGAREAFALVFRGPKGTPLPQQTHILEHDTLGIVEIFLVPIAPDAAGPRYEAVFN